MPTVDEAIHMIQKRYKGDEVIAFGIWTKKDVNRVAKKTDFELNKAEVNDILNILTEEFDPTIGITDEVIEETITDNNEGGVEGYSREDVEDFLPHDDET
jgi:hypothetical protein